MRVFTLLQGKPDNMSDLGHSCLFYGGYAQGPALLIISLLISRTRFREGRPVHEPLWRCVCAASRI